MSEIERIISGDRQFPKDFRVLTREFVILGNSIRRLNKFVALDDSAAQSFLSCPEKVISLGRSIHDLILEKGKIMGTGGYRQYNDHTRENEWVDITQFVFCESIETADVISSVNDQRGVAVVTSRQQGVTNSVNLPFRKDALRMNHWESISEPELQRLQNCLYSFAIVSQLF